VISFLEKPFLDKPRLPGWFRQPLPDRGTIQNMKTLLAQHGLNTVCEGAHCPNKNTCWQKGVATFMILGDTCTRACRFCAVKTGTPQAVGEHEPQAVADGVKTLGLSYVVVTSVTRDDLIDQGALHFSKTVRAIRLLNPQTKIEVLIPDLGGEERHLAVIIESAPEVISHNLETVAPLTSLIRPQADYVRSLKVLTKVKQLGFKGLVKSGLMLGMGETAEDLYKTFDDLRSAGCDILTLGQYLAPSSANRHIPVLRFVSPEEFVEMKNYALRLGFQSVVSGPLVRSSFRAEEGYLLAGRKKEENSYE
jgi:lipoyl synthase